MFNKLLKSLSVIDVLPVRHSKDIYLSKSISKESVHAII